MMTIQDLLDLSKTIAAPLFAGKTYPWEALADIGDFILQLGPTLPAEEYEQRGENIRYIDLSADDGKVTVNVRGE